MAQEGATLWQAGQLRRDPQGLSVLLSSHCADPRPGWTNQSRQGTGCSPRARTLLWVTERMRAQGDWPKGHLTAVQP